MKRRYIILIAIFVSIGISKSFAQRQSVGDYNVYFGTLHNHSNVSDGLGTPHEAYYYGCRYGDMDFFGLADHDLMMVQSEWEAIKVASDEFNKDGVFTTFRGFEWSSDIGHVAVINSEEYCSCKQKPEDSFKGFLDWVSTTECVVFFNHQGREDVNNNEFNHFTDIPSDKFVGLNLTRLKQVLSGFILTLLVPGWLKKVTS